MSDISMCINEYCPLKEHCYRYTATPHEIWQAYGNFEYYVDKDGQVKCDQYWYNNPKGNTYEKL